MRQFVTPDGSSCPVIRDRERVDSPGGGPGHVLWDVLEDDLLCLARQI